MELCGIWSTRYHPTEDQWTRILISLWPGSFKEYGFPDTNALGPL